MNEAHRVIEQHMIESLAEHGVDPSDLVPALMTTHTVNNPDFDPKEKERVDLEEALRKEAEADDEAEREAKAEEERRVVIEDQGTSDTETEPPPPYDVHERSISSATSSMEKMALSPSFELPSKSVNPFGFDDDVPKPLLRTKSPSAASFPTDSSTILSSRANVNPFGSDDEDEGPLSVSETPEAQSKAQTLSSLEEDEGDIGSARSPPLPDPSNPSNSPLGAASGSSADQLAPCRPQSLQTEDPSQSTPDATDEPSVDTKQTPRGEPVALFDAADPRAPAPLPALPGVSTSLSTTDEHVTLDIRWTVVSKFCLRAFAQLTVHP